MNNDFLDAINNQFTEAYAIVDEIDKLEFCSLCTEISDVLGKVSELQRNASVSQHLYKTAR